ncbi:hypothetical protein BKA56DRAFT_340756 [Ilyonectria sp. MPI-CAGE-AT-0026]|nr:hypothetical protein BKA56DRAFT_340756 [Ilyonectria sp. MPI-CAGE-AT-0026]
MKGNGDKKREPREVDDDGRDVAGDGAEGGDSRGSQRRTRTGRRWSRQQLRLSLEKTKLPGFGASKGIETVGELGWRGWLIPIHPQQSGPQQPSSPSLTPWPSAGGRAVSEWVGRGGTGACGLAGARAPKHFWGTPPEKKKTAEEAVVSCKLPATRYSPRYRYLPTAARRTPQLLRTKWTRATHDIRHSTTTNPAENRSDRHTLHAGQFAPALPLRRRLAARICFGLLVFLYFLLLFGFPGVRRRSSASNQSWLSWGVWVNKWERRGRLGKASQKPGPSPQRFPVRLVRCSPPTKLLGDNWNWREAQARARTPWQHGSGVPCTPMVLG